MNSKSKYGNIITLQRQDVEVKQCEKCNQLMVNLDEDEVRSGDLVTLKRKGVRLSNPHTKEVLCINCELNKEDKSFMGKVANWFDDDDDEDDTSLFVPRVPASTPSTSSGLSFGGFGGGGFSGGGASRGF